MKRRDFLKSTTLGTGALFLPKHSDASFASEKSSPKPIDIKLNIKPVYAGRVHIESYEGPCRWVPRSSPTPEQEKKIVREGSRNFSKRIRDGLSEDANKGANILETQLVELKRTWKEYEKGDIIDPEVWEKIDSEVSDIDLFLTSYRVIGLEKYKKPTAWVCRSSPCRDWSAFLRNEGVEGYAPNDLDEMGELIKLLRVRKAIKKTKILCVTDRPGKPAVCVLADIDLQDLKDRYGVDYEYVSYKEFFREMDRISQDMKEQENARNIQNRLVKNAQNVFMNKKYILNDVNFYLTTKSIMNRYNCNAFSMRCFELCGSHIPMDRKITACLTNILLKDEGYPTTCEGDINALLTNMVFMYLTKKPAYLGNTVYFTKENKIDIHHDSASLKMKGLEKAELPYEIQPFTDKTIGFGTTIRYDFSQDIGQEVTVARFQPVRRKVMLAKGKISGGINFRQHGCVHGLYIDIPNVKELSEIAADIGNHLVMVYGDCTDDMRKLCKMMDFEVMES